MKAPPNLANPVLYHFFTTKQLNGENYKSYI